jgi:hypothetical protein
MNVNLSINFSYLDEGLRTRAQSVCQSLSDHDMKPMMLSAQLGDRVSFPIDQIDAQVVRREWRIQAGRTDYFVWLGPVDGALSGAHETE